MPHTWRVIRANEFEKIVLGLMNEQHLELLYTDGFALVGKIMGELGKMDIKGRKLRSRVYDLVNREFWALSKEVDEMSKNLIEHLKKTKEKGLLISRSMINSVGGTDRAKRLLPVVLSIMTRHNMVKICIRFSRSGRVSRRLKYVGK